MPKFVSIEEAVKLIPDGATVMFGGFMGCGNAHKFIDALSKSGVKDLTMIGNDASMPGGPMGEDYYGCWGGVSFDFSLDDFGIYWEKIAVRSDIEQASRDSIIVEEIYNGLGLVMDTTERTDSIIYQYSDLNTEISGVDELLLRLHYHPDMPSGVTYDGAAQVIEGLYY